MDIQFSLWPMDDVHLEDDMQVVSGILEKHGLDHRMNRMSTSLTGDWDDAMKCIKECHDALRKTHKRVLCQITIDDDTA